MSPIEMLRGMGQELWYDGIPPGDRRAEVLERYQVTGMTTNPKIIADAVKSGAYRATIGKLAGEGRSAEQVLLALAGAEVIAAAQVLLPVFQASGGKSGFVSIEVPPGLADDTQGTVAAAKALHAELGMPNVMIKVPANEPGLAAATDLLKAGVPINFTLIFSRGQYLAAARAYQAAHTATPSVASVFIRRPDVAVNKRLDEIATGSAEEMPKVLHDGWARLAENAKNPDESRDASRAWKGGCYNCAMSLFGKVAIANAAVLYGDYLSLFPDKDAPAQVLLWASTGNVEPRLSPTHYVERLIAPRTINTVPPDTLEAFHNAGKPDLGLQDTMETAQDILRQAADLEVHAEQLFSPLQAEGIRGFAQSWTTALSLVDEQMK